MPKRDPTNQGAGSIEEAVRLNSGKLVQVLLTGPKEPAVALAVSY
jgi:hypothetical protein